MLRFHFRRSFQRILAGSNRGSSYKPACDKLVRILDAKNGQQKFRNKESPLSRRAFGNLIEELFKEIDTFHGAEPCLNIAEIDGSATRYNYLWPDDLRAFYRRYNCVKLFMSKYGANISVRSYKRNSSNANRY
jgi:hypothetical protein